MCPDWHGDWNCFPQDAAGVRFSPRSKKRTKPRQLPRQTTERWRRAKADNDTIPEAPFPPYPSADTQCTARETQGSRVRVFRQGSSAPSGPNNVLLHVTTVDGGPRHRRLLRRTPSNSFSQPRAGPSGVYPFQVERNLDLLRAAFVRVFF